MTVQLHAHDLSVADPTELVPSRRWSRRWTLGAVVLTVLVDLVAIWAVLHLFGPIGLLTAAVVAVGGLYLVATRPATSGLSTR